MNQKTVQARKTIPSSSNSCLVIAVENGVFSPHKELDVDHVNGIYTRSVYTEVRVGDTGKCLSLDFFFQLLDD